MSAPGTVIDDKVYLNEDAPFDVAELFFSRTDARGVIKAGNNVFQRISGYDWDELIGAPHKVIRHRDTPKAVFWLMWDMLKAGNPVGAYVKNRAKDGRHYWVYAIAVPGVEEYTSVRLKPTSPMRDVVEGIYKKIRQRENDGLSAEDSAQALLAELAELGFNDYASFMSSALSDEIMAREAQLESSAKSNMAKFAELLALLDSVQTEGRRIVKGFGSIEGAPKNMRIQATRMGASAAPLGVISTNFDTIATNIKSGIGPFIERLDHVAEVLCRGLFSFCSCTMLNEIIVQFETDTQSGVAQETLAEIAHLKQQRPAQWARTQNVLRDVLHEMAKFEVASKSLKQTLSGLNMMRVMSEIEIARIGDANGSLTEIVLQLERFQSVTQSCLVTIQTQCQGVEDILRHEIEGTRAV